MREPVSLRIARWLVRRYPTSFRQRYGEEIEVALERSIRERRVSGIRIVFDSAGILMRAWRDEWRSIETGPRVRGDWVHGVRYAARGLRRDPVHTLVSVGTLALAIGANAAVFSVAHTVLLRTLPYDAPERTVRVEPEPIRITATGLFAVLPALTELPRVEGTAVFTEGGSGNLALGAGAEPVHVTHVDHNFFDVLGARLAIGRGIAAEGEVVLTHGLWQRLFGGDGAILGRTIRLSDHSLTVVGVAAPEVEYPAGTDAWLSYPVFFDLMGAASGGAVIARIASEADIGVVRDGHEARMRALREESGDAFPENARPVFTPLRSSLVGPVEGSLWLLLGASALVLLLGCVNLAGLSLARVIARSSEFTVRRALGAGGGRLLRMMLAESMLIASLAGTVALLFMVWGRTLLIRLLPPELPGLTSQSVGLAGVAVILGLVMTTGVAIGILPAFHAAFRSRTSAVGSAGRVVEKQSRLHPALVVIQIGLAVVLVVSAALLGRSVVALRSVPLGFDTDRVVTFEARLPWAAAWDTSVFRAFAYDVRERLLAAPGVLEVGIGSRLPLSDGLGVGYRIWPDGRDEDATHRMASVVHASPTFFGALGIPIIAGTTFAADAGAAQSVMVSRSVAEQIFGRVDVVGETVRMRSTFEEPPVYMIVGVVEDVRAGGFAAEPSASIYLPFDRQPVPSMAFAVRTQRDGRDILAWIDTAVRDVNPAVAPFAVRTMRSAATGAIAARDALAIVSSLFGGMALLLAVLGSYGLVAQMVVRRRRELGLRLAVGARSVDLLTLVLRSVLRLGGAGIVFGAVAALGVTRFLRAYLWGIEPGDPVTFAAAAFACVAAILAAGLAPARRAARVDPLESLRSD